MGPFSLLRAGWLVCLGRKPPPEVGAGGPEEPPPEVRLAMVVRDSGKLAISEEVRGWLTRHARWLW